MPECTEAERAIIEAVVAGRSPSQARIGVWSERFKADPEWKAALDAARETQVACNEAVKARSDAWDALQKLTGAGGNTAEFEWLWSVAAEGKDF